MVVIDGFYFTLEINDTMNDFEISSLRESNEKSSDGYLEFNYFNTTRFSLDEVKEFVVYQCKILWNSQIETFFLTCSEFYLDSKNPYSVMDIHFTINKGISVILYR